MQAHACHTFAQAALFEKLLSQYHQLPVNKGIGLMDKADGNVGHHICGTGLHKFPIQRVGLRRLPAQVADILGLF